MNTKQEVLQNCKVEGNIVKLPSVQLERKLYQEVAKALELIGGKWKGGKVGGFVFQVNPTGLLEKISEGEKVNLKKEFQFFATPSALADEMVERAILTDSDTILEPSAGQGAIIKAINKVCNVTPDCYELMDVNRDVLGRSGLNFRLIGDDFLTHTGKKYTKIIANPPFTKNQDIDHIRLMYDTLEEGGTLVTLSSLSWETGSQKKQKEFRDWLDSLDHTREDIPEGTFKESGTNIRTKLIVIYK